MEIEITKMSPKGQVVIPSSVRKEAKFKVSDKFLVFGEDDLVIFKRIKKPEIEKSFLEVTDKLKDVVIEEDFTRKDLGKLVKEVRAGKK